MELEKKARIGKEVENAVVNPQNPLEIANKQWSEAFVIANSKAWQNKYTTIADLLAGQVNQDENKKQFVLDASTDDTVDSGWAAYELVNAKTGSIADYRKLSEEESLEGGDVLDGFGWTDPLKPGSSLNDTHLRDWLMVLIRDTSNARSVYLHGVANDYSDLALKMNDANVNTAALRTTAGDTRLAIRYPYSNSQKYTVKGHNAIVIGIDISSPSGHSWSFKDAFLESTTSDGIEIYAGNGGRSNPGVDYQGQMFITRNELAEAAPASKPDKIITATTDYTAIPEDKNKHLVFQNSINFIIPPNVFTVGDEVEFDAQANDLTVVAETGMTVNQVASLTKVIPQHGVGEIRFKSATTAILYGSLKPL